MFSNNKLPKFLYNPVIWLLFTALLVFITNIRVGKYLTGWDNLQIELDYFLSIKRNFFAAWQEYQGLGLPSGHAHSVDLIRALLFFPVKYLMPDFLYRYFFHVSMLFVGSLGIYLLLKSYVVPLILSDKSIKIFAFIGALFYMLNLGTVQNFYPPLEPFSAFYAFFPLSIYYIIRYLKKGGVRNLLFLNLAFILLTISYQIQTFFVVFSLAVNLPLAFFLIFKLIKKNFVVVRRVLVAFMSQFIVNAFWLFNVVYFYIGSLNVRFDSITNRFASEDSFLQNVEYANALDVFLLRGFWIGNKDYINSKGMFGFMMEPWVAWVSNFVVIAVLFIVLLLVGVFASLYLKKLRHTNVIFYLFYLLLLSLFFFFNINGPAGFLYKGLVTIFPTFGEIFRFPFTKWVVVYVFSYSVFVTLGASYLYTKLLKVDLNKHKKLKGINLCKLYPLLLIFIVVLYSLPVFKGDLFYKNLRQDIPEEYLQMFDYFKSKPSGARVANLPQPSFWGWGYTDWGYRGSGFIWYGIPQSITDRAFDVWNYKNEQFYNEFQYAIYSEDSILLSYILNKYQIDYLLLDKNVITPGSPRATFYPQTQVLLAKTKGVEKVEEFGEIDVYLVKSEKSKVESFVYTPDQFEVVDGGYEFSNVDPAFYSAVSDYVSFPYLLSSQAQQSDLDTSIGSSDEILNPRLNRDRQVQDDVEVSFPFADDKDLADRLNNNNSLSFVVQGGSSLVIPNLKTDKPLPAKIYTTSGPDGLTLDIGYIYPNITDLSGGQVYGPKYTDSKVVQSQDNFQLLIDNVLFQNLAKNTFLLDQNSTAVAFSGNPSGAVNLSYNLYSAEPFECGGEENGSYGKLVSGNSITLLARRKNVCTEFIEDIEVTKPSILRVEFTYKSDTNSSPLYCISNGGDCLNAKYQNSPYVSMGYTTYVDYVYVNEPTTAKFSAILENPLAEEAEVTFKDINIQIFDVFSETSLSPNINAYETNAVIEFDSKQTLVLNTPDYGDLSRTYVPGSKYFNPTEKNCDNFNAVDYSRDFVMGSGSSPSYFSYKAKDAISCDSIKTNSLSGESSYLITFEYVNIAGKAMDICVAGTNLDKCMILDRLEKSQETSSKIQKDAGSQIQRQSFILPSYPSVSDYTVNIANQSIGRVEAENNIYGVETRYIPYEFFKGVSLANGEGQMANSINVVSVNHKFPHRYDVAISYKQAAISKTSLLVLNQSFDKGWGLYSKESCKFGIVSPITCSKAPAEHVLAKNWSNGWLLENNKIQDTNNKNSTDSDLNSSPLPADYLLLFWPQWLQYLGYISLILWVIFITVLYWRDRN